MKIEQRLVNIDELQIGDEIIISCYSELKYLKIKSLPKPGNSRVKVSLRRDVINFGKYTWKSRKFEQDVSLHNDIMWQDLYGKHIFLLKREE